MEKELSAAEKAEFEKTYLMQQQLDAFRYAHGYRPLTYEEFDGWRRSAKGEAILEVALRPEYTEEAEWVADDAAFGASAGAPDDASAEKIWGETYTKVYDQVYAELLDKAFAEDRP
jgi:hypothetical protein